MRAMLTRGGEIANHGDICIQLAMSFLRVFGLTALLVLILVSSSCSGSSNTNSQSSATAANARAANVAKSNTEELRMLVNVPYEVEDIVWKDYPSSKKVLAVLKFSPADADKIVADAEAAGAPETVSIPVETWFPEELIAQAGVSGDDALKGSAYPATTFFQEPYNSGRITRVGDSDFFVLEVAAK